MAAAAVAALNAALSSIPVDAGYDIALDMAGSFYRCTSNQGHGSGRTLHVESLRSANEGFTEARCRLTADSAETLAKAARAGQAGVMRMLASRQLRVEGDISQLQALRNELAPHQSRLEGAVAAAIVAESTASDSSTSSVLWVPNDHALECMGARCRRPFTFFIRRHHCRACGGVFCRRCAPPTEPKSARACRACLEGRASSTGTRPQPGTAAHAVGSVAAAVPAPASGTAVDGSFADVGAAEEEEHAEGSAEPAGAAGLLVEWHVEQQLRGLRFSSRCGLVTLLAVPGVLLAWAWRPLLGRPSVLLAAPLPVQAALSAAVLVLLLLRHLIVRLARVAWICAVIAVSVMWTSQQARGRPERGEKAIWEMAHRVHARYLLDAVTQLSGFYVKVAQTLSIQTGIPEPFHQELAKLQDSMPADPHEEVEKTLAEDLGKDWRRLVRLHPGPPLGSATIAQVHRATLRVAMEDGSEVEVEGVIKVQHRGMKGNLTVDTYAAGILAKAMVVVAPSLFEDFGDIIREVAAMTKAELDFRIEAENQRLAREAALAAGVDVIVPLVYTKLVTRRVLAMEYVEGVRMSDFARQASREERTRAVRELVGFFAFSFTQAGIFNCDPHPGNLLITKEGRLCILDWGQARRLTSGEMEAYSLTFCAASLEDPYLLVQVGKRLGSSWDLDKACSMVGALRFLMRDSRPLAMSKEDMVNLEAMFARFPPEMSNVKGDAKGILRGALLPLSKTVDLLHNVSTRFAVNLSLLQVFTARGYELALRACELDGVPVPSLRSASVGFALHPAPVLGLTSEPMGSLDSQLRAILAQAHARGNLLGAQLVVLDATTGSVLSDLACGHCSYLRPAPVTRTTPFNTVEVSKLPLALSALSLIEAGHLGLEAKLGDLWPAAKALREVTVEQILAHTSGVMHIIPKGITEFEKLCDLDGMLRHIEISGLSPLLEPGSKQQYHHHTFGWLLTGALRGARQDLMRCLRALVPEQALNRGALGRQEAADPTKVMNSSGIEDIAALFENVNRFLDICERAKVRGATLEEKADREVCMGIHGVAHWLSPAALQEPAITHGMLPGVVAYGTASSLAGLLLRTARGELLRPETVQDMRRSRKPSGSSEVKLPPEFHHFQEADWGLGVELVKVPDRENGELAWGHTAACGSFALFVPGKRSIVATLLLNRIDGWKSGLSHEVLRACAKFAAADDLTASV